MTQMKKVRSTYQELDAPSVTKNIARLSTTKNLLSTTES